MLFFYNIEFLISIDFKYLSRSKTKQMYHNTEKNVKKELPILKASMPLLLRSIEIQTI